MKYWIYVTVAVVIGFMGLVFALTLFEPSEYLERDEGIINTDSYESQSEISAPRTKQSDCPNHVHMDPNSEKYNATAIECIDKAIKNCEIKPTVITYELGSMQLLLKIKAEKCLVSITDQDWRKYEERNNICVVPLDAMQDWNSWRNPKGPDSTKDIAQYCYSVVEELTAEQEQAMGQVRYTIILGEMNKIIQKLPDTAFDDSDLADQRKNELQNMLLDDSDSVLTLIKSRMFDKAMDKLNNDVRIRMDSSANGNPEDDWVTDKNAQQKLLAGIDELIEFLKEEG